jgi:hypothetical protein
MYGADGEPAMLADGGGSKGTVSGARITFWTDSEEVEIVDSAITMDADGLKMPQGPGGGK